LLVLALSAALLLLVSAFGGRREAIARAEAAASRLQLQRDSLIGEVRIHTEAKAALERERALHSAQADRLRDSIAHLERSRAERQLAVRRTRTVGELQTRLRAAFPELGDSGWGLTTVPLEGDTLGLEYLMVPAWFAETFIIDHRNAESWREQKNTLLVVDSLGLLVTALQDSVAALVTANARAYQAGYDAAYAGFQDVSGRYVAELRKPRMSFGGTVGIIAAAGAGFFLGRVAHE
jgi:hypothetical protein